MEEEFKNIEGFEGFYQVSNLGNIKSLKNNLSLIGSIAKEGYRRVILYKNTHRTYATIHRIVAKAFLENPENKKMVNHIDGNKLNNHVRNLEYVTPGENLRHAYSINLKSAVGSKNGQAKLSEEMIPEIRRRILLGDKTSVISKDFNINPSTLCDIKFNRTWTHV